LKFNQSIYLQRIRYAGPLQPTLKVLQNLQSAHLFQVPFENLDVHLQRPIVLDVDRFYTKIVEQNRGGFCYELNGLFYELLVSLGFAAYRISCRVFNAEKGYGADFDHLAILVKIGETQYLTDVGFGDFTMQPLAFVLGKKQEDPNGIFVFDNDKEGFFRVQKKMETTWSPQYIFQNKAKTLLDFSAMCDYHQNNPASHFTQKRLISKPIEEGRITLTGNILKIRKGKKLEERKIKNKEEFDQILWDFFEVKI